MTSIEPEVRHLDRHDAAVGVDASAQEKGRVAHACERSRLARFIAQTEDECDRTKELDVVRLEDVGDEFAGVEDLHRPPRRTYLDAFGDHGPPDDDARRRADRSLGDSDLAAGEADGATRRADAVGRENRPGWRVADRRGQSDAYEERSSRYDEEGEAEDRRTGRVIVDGWKRDCWVGRVCGCTDLDGGVGALCQRSVRLVLR